MVSDRVSNQFYSTPHGILQGSNTFFPVLTVGRKILKGCPSCLPLLLQYFVKLSLVPPSSIHPMAVLPILLGSLWSNWPIFLQRIFACLFRSCWKWKYLKCIFCGNKILTENNFLHHEIQALVRHSFLTALSYDSRYSHIYKYELQVMKSLVFLQLTSVYILCGQSSSPRRETKIFCVFKDSQSSTERAEYLNCFVGSTREWHTRVDYASSL